MTGFSQLELIEPLQRTLAAENYHAPTPIQARAIPHLLRGRDLLGLAQTGTGKTAAFALPILQRLVENKRRAAARSARVLVLTPTRELAIQIGESFRTYGRQLPLAHALVFGGVGQTPQVKALAPGVDILVATPGRLLDLIGQGHLRLDSVEMFVLDEADRMLDMGFIHDVRKIVAKLPVRRQTLLFSATMPAAVANLAMSVLVDPQRVEVAPPSTTLERIRQHVLFVEKPDKRALLVELLGDPAIKRALVFTRTKHAANRLAEWLERDGVRAGAIHGNKSQAARQKALEAFRAGRLRVLVATDIAARGIDIDAVTHVINFDLPHEPETYVHRIGRTARAGADGIAMSFCDADEAPLLRDIQKAIRQTIALHSEHSYHAPRVAEAGSRGGGQRSGAGGNGRSDSRQGAGGKPRRHGYGRRAA